MVAAFDIDLLVYVGAVDGQKLRYPNDWKPDGAMQQNIRRRVKQQLKQLGWKVQIADDAHYRYVLQLKVNGVDVDLLLVPDLVPGSVNAPRDQHRKLMSPVYDKPAVALYDQLRERADTAALTKVTQSCSDDVKRVVRLTKTWVRRLEEEGRLKGHKGASGDPRISSIALEVLVMAANQQFRKQHDGREPSGSELLAAALRLIMFAVERRKVVMLGSSPWGSGEWGYSRKLGMCCARLNWERHPVRIIHPTDPTCNLARSRVHRPASDWQGLAREARKLNCPLTSGTFDDLMSSTLALAARALRP